jgi:putative polyhydroxyalkanoate system protein
VSEINLHHDHTLGLDKARDLARQWAQDASRQMGLSCQHEEGVDKDTVTFERMGVHGVMTVTANSFDLKVKLGMMMAAFKPMIEAEIRKNLGRIMNQASGQH